MLRCAVSHRRGAVSTNVAQINAKGNKISKSLPLISRVAPLKFGRRNAVAPPRRSEPSAAVASSQTAAPITAASPPAAPLTGGYCAAAGKALTDRTICWAAAADAGGAGIAGQVSGSKRKTLYLGFLFLTWYGFSIGFGVFNKQVLNVFPYPTTLTLLNLLVGSVMASLMWITGFQDRPKLTKKTLLAIAPLAVVHTIGNLLTNISLGKVAVSFTHTIKSCEPFFSVLFSAIFLGDIPSAALVASLVPIVAGISLASFTEPSFNWIGLFAALGSNVTFTSRNVFSKKVMGNVKMENINLFSIITIMSMCMCAPITLMIDGFRLTPEVISGPIFAAVGHKALLAGVCFHAYQQISYMVLQRVTPVTHSVGKCVKSVVVIVASIIAFNNPIGPLNAVGTAIALLGVCAYSAVKTHEKRQKALEAKSAKEPGSPDSASPGTAQ